MLQEPLKVLLIITRLDRGGSSDAVLNLAAGLKEKGCLVKVVYGRTNEPGTDLSEFVNKYAVELININELQREIDPLKDLIALMKLSLLIRHDRPDIVHTHSSKAGILGRIAAWLAGVKVIVHSPHGHIFYGYFGRFRTKMFVWLERIMALASDRIITLTELGKEDHVRLRIANAEKFVSIPCGIDLGRLNSKRKNDNLREELGLSHNDKIVGWVGRLEPIKGCHYFLEACKIASERLNNTKFIIAGDGEMRDELKEYSLTLGMHNKIFFLGTRDDIPEVMQLFDVLVLSSLNEGLGRVLIEAMASSVPIVATSVGGVPEVLGMGKAGRLVPPKNANEMASAIVRALTDQKLARDYVREAKNRSQLYSVEKMVLRNYELYMREFEPDYRLAVA